MAALLETTGTISSPQAPGASEEAPRVLIEALGANTKVQGACAEAPEVGKVLPGALSDAPGASDGVPNQGEGVAKASPSNKKKRHERATTPRAAAPAPKGADSRSSDTPAYGDQHEHSDPSLTVDASQRAVEEFLGVSSADQVHFIPKLAESIQQALVRPKARQRRLRSIELLPQIDYNCLSSNLAKAPLNFGLLELAFPIAMQGERMNEYLELLTSGKQGISYVRYELSMHQSLLKRSKHDMSERTIAAVRNY